MINTIHPAESGKHNNAPNVLDPKAVEVSERRLDILQDAVAAVLRSIPAPKDIKPLSRSEQQTQPAVNEQFIQMTTGLEKQYIDEQINQMEAGLKTDLKADFVQPHPPITDPNAHISLVGGEHPNQAAIDEAMLRTLEAYANSPESDMRV